MNPTQFALHGLVLEEAEYQIKQAGSLASLGSMFSRTRRVDNYATEGIPLNPVSTAGGIGSAIHDSYSNVKATADGAKDVGLAARTVGKWVPPAATAVASVAGGIKKTLPFVNKISPGVGTAAGATMGALKRVAAPVGLGLALNQTRKMYNDPSVAEGISDTLNQENIGRRAIRAIGDPAGVIGATIPPTAKALGYLTNTNPNSVTALGGAGLDAKNVAMMDGRLRQQQVQKGFHKNQVENSLSGSLRSKTMTPVF